MTIPWRVLLVCLLCVLVVGVVGGIEHGTIWR